MLLYNAQEYLIDLLEFARLRIHFSGLDDRPSDIEPVAKRLEDSFGHPFKKLIKEENLETGQEQVQHIRVAIELLRHYLKSNSIDTEDADQHYLMVAYPGILIQLGSSYEELRMNHASGDKELNEDRESLANRLNLDRVDRLGELFIEPDNLSEEKLESLFGLAATDQDVFESSPSQPKLLKWKVDYFRKKWKDNPTPFHSDNNNVPLLDPDLVPDSWLLDKDEIENMDFVISDIVDEVLRTAAVDLYQSRVKELEKIAEDIQEKIDEAKESESDVRSAFDLVMESFLGKIDLEAVLKERTEGPQNPDQDNEDKDLRVNLQALRRLVRLRKLASSGSLTEKEWIDVVHILVQNNKLNRYDKWLDEEEEFGLFLSPDFFSIPQGRQDQPVPTWRAERKTRLRWKDALRARQKQLETTVNAIQSTIDNTTQKALYKLRDQLMITISDHTGESDPDEVAEILTNRLMLDFKNRDRYKTSRLDQANEALQGLIFKLRMEQPIGGKLAEENGVEDWELTFNSDYTKDDFEQDWHWLGTYRTRRAAEFVKDFPENFLNPNLREDEAPQPPTEAFSDLIDDLYTSSKLTIGKARELAHHFLNKTEDKHRSKIDQKLRQISDEVVSSFELTEQVSEQEIVFRQKLSKELIDELDIKRKYRNDEGELIDIEDPHRAPVWIQEIFYFVPMALALQLRKSGEYLAALDWYQTVYAYQFAPQERKVYHGLNLENDFSGRPRITPDIWLREQLNPHFFARERKFAYSQFTIMSIVRCVLDYADSEFTAETRESISRARSLYTTAHELIGDTQMTRSNPKVQSLQRHVEVNLGKLRNGQNIAGMERTHKQQSGDANGQTGLPVIGQNGQLIVNRSVSPPPTPYRYTVLIERAKELVNIAQQMESAFLSAQEKRDNKDYNRQQAEHDLNLSRSRIDLQNLRVTQADDNITIAEMQNDRTQIQHDTYQEWIDEGLINKEKDVLDRMHQSLFAPDSVSASVGFPEGFSISASYSPSGKMKTMANMLSTQASHERRQQQWQLQKGLAKQDMEIAEEKIDQAEQQKKIVEKEHFIAAEQKDFAQATVDFLSNKFSNRELYEYMSGVLNRIYSYFLQQATATAQLASHQLAFQRQSPTTFIRSNYWQQPTESRAAPKSGDQKDDLKGVTGSARLLQDIYKLDQFSFETKERKLQLSQTFSLAHLFPFEFQQFSKTGVLPFSTSMELFDRGFPGHYLRLIKNVRVSVIALVPPTQGIRASLTAAGTSRVITKGDTFQTTIVQRDPEMIAFTSPREASGLFQLEAEDKMLWPFEGRGVDTNWNLEMPRAANSFDYNSIADVLLTIEYTAFNSQQLRSQVIQEMDQRISGERSFSLQEDFPDQWYALNNPDQSSEPMKVSLQTRRADFPPNIERLKIGQVLIYFTTADDVSLNEMTAELEFTEKGASEAIGGQASPVDGVISTRRASAGSWTSILGKTPDGEWEFSLPDMEQLFKEEKIKDILFVLTYEGQSPAWPDFG